MRVPRWAVGLSVIDLILFIVCFAWNDVRAGLEMRILTSVSWGYWITATIGLVFTVYGFIVLTRRGGAELRKSVLLILFAMTPGCVALIGFLTKVGSHPV